MLHRRRAEVLDLDARLLRHGRELVLLHRRRLLLLLLTGLLLFLSSESRRVLAHEVPAPLKLLAELAETGEVEGELALRNVADLVFEDGALQVRERGWLSSV